MLNFIHQSLEIEEANRNSHEWVQQVSRVCSRFGCPKVGELFWQPDMNSIVLHDSIGRGRGRERSEFVSFCKTILYFCILIHQKDWNFLSRGTQRKHTFSFQVLQLLATQGDSWFLILDMPTVSCSPILGGSHLKEVVLPVVVASLRCNNNREKRTNQESERVQVQT